jgi:hypothetical protein
LFFCFLFFVQGFFPWLVPFFCISFESSFLVILLFSTTFHWAQDVSLFFHIMLQFSKIIMH